LPISGEQAATVVADEVDRTVDGRHGLDLPDQPLDVLLLNAAPARWRRLGEARQVQRDHPPRSVEAGNDAVPQSRRGRYAVDENGSAGHRSPSSAGWQVCARAG